MNSDSDSVESIDYNLHRINIEEHNETNRRLSDRRRGIMNPQSSKRAVTPIPLNRSYVNNNLPHHDDVPLKTRSWFLYICCFKRN